MGHELTGTSVPPDKLVLNQNPLLAMIVSNPPDRLSGQIYIRIGVEGVIVVGDIAIFQGHGGLLLVLLKSEKFRFGFASSCRGDKCRHEPAALKLRSNSSVVSNDMGEQRDVVVENARLDAVAFAVDLRRLSQ